jgi:class 3 adenylate cyclase
MEEAARPAVRSNGGRVIKQDADDLFAIFGNPAEALEAALDIFRAFDAVNIVAPAERDIYGSIGIGYGDLLVVGGDLFGSEVNLACKLGEDLAKKKEILLTESAYEALPRGLYLFEPATFSISGMDINCYRYHAKVGIPAPPSRA